MILDKWRRTAFVWGVSDCVMSVADYVRDKRGIDPAAAWRGVYNDRAGAEAVFLPFGGVLGLVTYAAAKIGLERLEAPLPGCVVVADFAGSEVAGIYLGPRCAFRAERGVVEIKADVLGAWAV